MNLPNKKHIYLSVGAFFILLILIISIYVLSRNPPGESTENSFPQGEGREIFPSGELGPQNTAPETTGEPAAEGPSRLFSMHDKPVISSVAFVRSGKPLARFIEQGTGHVYEYDFEARKSYRISNTSIPQIAQALWSQDGNTVAFRYEDAGQLKAGVGELGTSTAESTFKKISFLPEGIQSLALSPDGTQVFYIVPGAVAGTAAGVVARKDGASPRVVFNSKLPRWFATWPTRDSVLISSPHSDQGGAVYRITASSGAQTLVYTTKQRFMGAAGSPQGDILVTDPSNGRISRLNQQTGGLEARLFISWPSLCAFAATTTASAVCAQVPQAGMPLWAAWERGEYDFKSTLGIMHLTDDYFELPLDETEVGDRVFDIVHPSLAPDLSHAIFTNRVDGLLWGVLLR